MTTAVEDHFSWGDCHPLLTSRHWRAPRSGGGISAKAGHLSLSGEYVLCPYPLQPSNGNGNDDGVGGEKAVADLFTELSVTTTTTTSMRTNTFRKEGSTEALIVGGGVHSCWQGSTSSFTPAWQYRWQWTWRRSPQTSHDDDTNNNDNNNKAAGDDNNIEGWRRRWGQTMQCLLSSIITRCWLLSATLHWQLSHGLMGK